MNIPKIIVALDLNYPDQLDKLLTQLTPEECVLKIGKAMFLAKGPAFVEGLIQKGFNIFLDLKFHDIPNQVANAVLEAAKLGVWMVNVHALGGKQMMLAAKEALEAYAVEKGKRPLLIAVTILTSLDSSDLNEVGLMGSVEENVIRLAKLTKECGLDGVVCSAQEAALIKDPKQCGQNFITVTPGIRLETDLHQDQKRMMTPKEAIQAGADYLVMGRPITGSKDPISVIRAINQSIQ